jgi:hypothetical protein
MLRRGVFPPTEGFIVVFVEICIPEGFAGGFESTALRELP